MVTGPEKWQCNNCVIGMWGLRSERRNMVMKLENGERYTPPELRRIYQEWESTCQGNVNKRENSLRFLSSKYNIVHVLSRSVEQFTNVRKTNLRLFPAMQKICITECILIILVLKVHDLSRRLNFLLAYVTTTYGIRRLVKRFSFFLVFLYDARQRKILEKRGRTHKEIPKASQIRR